MDESKLKCPVCGNMEKFVCDIIGMAHYDQTTDSFTEVGDFDINTEHGYVCCLKCKHQAPYDYFKE